MAATVRWYDDVQVGDELPPLVKQVTVTRMMVYGAATWDFIRAHYDAEYARQQGFPAPFADGQMFGAVLAQQVQDWAGPRAFLRKLSFRNRTMCFPNDSVTAHGVVTRKWIENGEALVECDLWVDNQRGEKVVQPAKAVVRLPQRRS